MNMISIPGLAFVMAFSTVVGAQTNTPTTQPNGAANANQDWSKMMNQMMSMGNPAMGGSMGSMNPMTAMNPMAMMNPMTMMPMMMAPMSMMGPMMNPMGMMGGMNPMTMMNGMGASGAGGPNTGQLGPALMMNPQNWFNPATYTYLMSPQAMQARMNPQAWMNLMNPNTFMPMMNPNAYMQAMTQAMDPNTYANMAGKMMTPEVYEKWYKEMTSMVPQATEAPTDGTATQ